MKTRTNFLFYTCILSFLFSPFIFAGGNREVKDEGQLVCVINYPYQIWSEEPTKIHVTLFKPDFTPAKGAIVEVNSNKVGKADKNGTCIFDFVPGSGNSHELKAELIDKGTRYRVTKQFSCNARTMSFKAERLYVYTDRGVYNPGQDVLVRLVAWELKKEYTPLAEASVQLLFQDLNGKVYSGEYITTDDFGIGAAKLPLPQHMPEGEYELVVLYEQAREATRLRVKRFVPPVININHNLKRYLTNVQDSLEAEVTAGYFTGGEIKQSSLTLSIEDMNKRELFKKEYSSGTGTYSISLNRTDLDIIRTTLVPETEIKVKLKIKDSYDQEDEVIWDMLYTACPFTAVIEIDKDSYPGGETVQLLVKVVDIDGQPAAEIPLILGVDSEQIHEKAATDTMGVARFEFTMPGNAVTATVTSPVMEAALGQRYIPFEASKPMSSRVTEFPRDAGTKTTITVHFDPGYVPVEDVIHIDLTDISGALVESTTIPIQKNKLKAEGEITAPTWGTMLVNLYCCAVKKGYTPPYSVQTAGFITEGQHVTFYPDKELEIVVENFKPEAGPGDEVAFTINVKGGEGEKSLGVSLVDDAVISLLNPFVKAPVTHFYNPQAKVIATGGAGVLTWPVVDRNWGYPWRDIAYSNWGFKEPGDFVIPAGSEDKESTIAYSSISEDTDIGNDETYYEKKSMEESSEEGLGEAEESFDHPKETTNGDERKSKDGNGDKDRPQAEIIIRTRFPETSFWEPRLITKNRKAAVRIALPEEITTQKLFILASDKQGFISLLKKDIRVTQPVFIRADFPPSLVKGDKVTARALLRNLTDSSLSCAVTLDSPGLSVLQKPEGAITIEPGETKIAEWVIQGKVCGINSFTVSVETKGAGGKRFTDAEKKSLYVKPQGEPVIRLVKDTISGKGKSSLQLTIDPGAEYYTAFLNVTLPDVFPAFQAWYAYDLYPWYSPWAVSATALMNSALLEYVRSSKKKPVEESHLVERLEHASMILVSSQYESGAWGWYTDNRENDAGTNLYYTLYCLRGLLDIKRAGLPVRDETIKNAIRYIFTKQNNDRLWASKGAYFWDVYNDQVDISLSAEIFEVLALAMTLMEDPYEFEPGVRILKEKMVTILSSGSEEPMTMAAAVQGLLYWKEFARDSEVDPVLKKGIATLIALKRRGYWEPHWYHAYGGMVELNARILTLLAAYEPEQYASYLREGVTWLLSTREAWGAWHNEIGTATAIRALLSNGAQGEEVKSEITVMVNGKKAAGVTIDPSDPFLSAAKLHYLEITGFLNTGNNIIEVTYTGNLDAPVILEKREWGTGVNEETASVTVKKTIPGEAAVGQSFSVKLTLESRTMHNMIIVEEFIPPQCEPDEKSLDALVRNHEVIDYRIEEGNLLFTLIQSSAKTELRYRLRPVRRGTSFVRGTRVMHAADGIFLGASGSATITIQ
ncbi:MAG: hypothetical protein JXB88_05690 [Spirochaetales bacterium]|nr:hypothetical protein [Spirochaetales bacterium]